MNERNRIWYWISSCVCICIVTLILSITTYYRHQDKIVAKMVSDGENPMEALCSMTDTYGTHPLCLALAVNKQ